MILEKLKEELNFTNHEKEVAHYILENMEKIPEMSTAQLAQANFTSKATIVRFIRKLGLPGYQEFKLKLVEEINQKNRIGQLLVNEPITDKSSYSDIINTLPMLYDKAVTNTRLSLDKNRMKRINHVLQGAACIDLYGTGISYILAQSAAFKFSTLGL
ncbi:MAG: MurR/RpiR family transcriptional regulator, partial [Lachnospiraceae bacterium]|nr:MurR/RpiR family transcriptional regulator [Lachnospiraceae bacterium]